MRFRAILAISALCSLLASCAYPVATVEQGVTHSALYFPGAPEDARVFVDGADAGLAAAYDGRKSVLRVEPGKHHVVIGSGAGSLYDQEVYVGDDSRLAIEVR
ncbi:MAG: hypothetical protein ACM3YN_14540 [Parcubacteria group bacterium]